MILGSAGDSKKALKFYWTIIGDDSETGHLKSLEIKRMNTYLSIIKSSLWNVNLRFY